MKRVEFLIIVSLGVVFSNPNVVFAQRLTDAQQIHQAIVDGDIEQVKSLLSKNVDVNVRNRMGWTPLHTALTREKWEIAELLISKNPDFNIRDNQGRTPLYIAVEKDQKKIVDLLLAKNVDVNAVARGGQNALTLARSMNNKELTDLLLKHGAEEPVLDMEGDMLYGPRGGAPRGGASTIGTPMQPMAPARPTNEPSVLENPNEIKARIKTFAGLEKAIKQVDAKGATEERQWRQTRYDNRTLLSRAVQGQFEDEMALIKKTAVAEKAKKTVAAIDNLVKLKQERNKAVYKELLQQRKELEQSQSVRGRGRGRTSGRGGRGRSSIRGNQYSNNMSDSYYDSSDTMGRGERPTRPTRPEEQRDPQTEEEIRLWTQASIERKNDLLKNVHEKMMTEIGFIRIIAVEEKAKKTTAAIDGLMLARLERYDQTVLKMEEDARKEEERQKRLEQRYGRGSGRQPNSTQQNTQQRGRGRRR